MKQAIMGLALGAAALALPLALGGCGKSADSGEQSQAGNVEMPAEEAVHDLDPSAAPMAEAAGDAASDGLGASDAAAAGASPAAPKPQ